MKGIVFALLAAFLFGASTPLAKSLLPQVSPVLMAGLLYLSSGIGLGAYRLICLHTKSSSKEAALSRRDVPWLAGAIVTGGIIAPICLMWGLTVTPASNASLLLNLEAALTALLAWFVFKEHFNARIALGMALIVIGGVCLSWLGRPEGRALWGLLAIFAACLGWAIDNNLTRKISAGDPVQIAMLKGLVAGIVSILLALLTGIKMPAVTALLWSGVIGFFGYGVSLTLFVFALRHIGAARTSAYFSVAPFVGAVISILFLGDKLTTGLIAAAVLMSVGVWLHLTERHEHLHRHEPIKHAHLHSHDEHHQHAHEPNDPPGEPHTHWHQHQELVHAHPHYPDIHHRHSHGN
jgi:drug/metabolite transporter (DMT)-like permease